MRPTGGAPVRRAGRIGLTYGTQEVRAVTVREEHGETSAGPAAGLDRARDAVGREAWAEAYDLMSATPPALLGPGDLEKLAEAAWWLSRLDESVAARQRSYAGYTAAGEEILAAGIAVRLATEHFFRGEGALGAGWLARAQRHLRDKPETFQHGLLACAESTVARFSGELEGSQALAERAAEIGRRLRDPDLMAMGVHLEGLALIAGGRVAEGLALLDEAMTSVVAGELTSYFTGVVYCNVLRACLELADLRRAGEWNEASRAWCESLPPESPFPGLCRINRAELATLTGAWAEAGAEASRASEEVMRLNPAAAGAAVYETGEVRRREGDLAGAAEAFSRAHELGFEPQPGLALVRLAQGRPGSAVSALRLALTGESGNRLRRARLLAALVDAALALPDLDAATEAAEELEGIAREFRSPALEASAATARGSVLLARGDVAGAVGDLRRACATWQEVRVPYDTARTRMLYGLALRAAGDEDDARLELRAALGTFERLGAARDLAAAAELLGETRELPRGLTSREAEVLRLVAAGKTNRDIAAQLVISEYTVARHLQNIFAKLDVSSRSAATAFAFQHHLT